MIIAQWIANLLLAYATIGVLFGAAFVVFGVSRVDPAASGIGRGGGGPIGFRLLILPGAAGLWPVMLVKWVKAARRPADTRAEPAP